MKLIKNSEGFKLLYKDREIINHTKDSPFIFIGKGTTTFDMHGGNFKIEDYLKERLALSDVDIKENKEQIEIVFSRAGLLPIKVSFSLENDRLIIKFKEDSKALNRIWLRFSADKEEYIYGGGEQFTYFNLRGKNFPLWVSEQGVGRNKKTYETFKADAFGAGGDYYTTFFPQPTFVSSKKYFLHVNDSSYMDFNFKNNSFHELQIWDIPSEIIIGAEDDYVKLLENLTELLGRQPELPDWVYDGIWLGVQGGTDIALSKLKNAQKKGVKVSGIWAQDWEGERITSFGKRLIWNWIWDAEMYPNLDKEIKKLNEKGIKFLGYTNPYLAADASLYKEASSKGLIVKNNKGEDYLINAGEFDIGIVDITNPVAFDWYKDVIKKYMIDFGLSGWMADFGEYLPTDAILFNDISAEKMHNVWPVLWAKVNREAIEEAGKLGEIVFFMRSGYSESARYSTMTWAGDQNVTWSVDDGLPSVIPSALSLGMSGMGLHHSDIGGYTTLLEMKRTKELLIRWAEFSAFTPIMRTHEGNRPDDNWQFDSDNETLSYIARMTEVFTKLAPYTKEAVKENAQKGTPVMRPLFMHYENDKKSYEIKYEYLYGRDLLVAPVCEEGKTSWKAYLPEDEWIHLWTGDEYRGGDVEVKSELGYPPVFYRKGSKFKELFKAIEAIE